MSEPIPLCSSYQVHATLEGDRFDGEEFAPQGASRTMDAVTAEGFLHTPTTTPAPPDSAPVGGPDQDVGVGSRPEVAHRPKGGLHLRAGLECREGSVDGGGGDAGEGRGGGSDQEQRGDGQGHQHGSQAGHGTPPLGR